MNAARSIGFIELIVLHVARADLTRQILAIHRQIQWRILDDRGPVARHRESQLFRSKVEMEARVAIWAGDLARALLARATETQKKSCCQTPAQKQARIV